MGSRLFLPTGPYNGPHPLPQNERESLLQRLWKTRTLLPGAREMEIQQLRDYVQAQEQKQVSGHYDKVAPATKTAEPLSPKRLEQVRGALKEYCDWRRKKLQAMGLIPKYD